MNLIMATVKDGQLRFADVRWPLPTSRDLAAYEGRGIVVGIRPTDLEDAALARDASRPALEVDVDVTEELGAEMNVIFTLDACPVVTDATRAVHDEEVAAAQAPLLETGAQPEQAVCTAQVDARSGITANTRARLCVDVERLHFFDPGTGLAAGRRA